MKLPLETPLPPASGLAKEFRATGMASLEHQPSQYPPALHARLVTMWSQRLVVEYRSSTVFSQLAGQLIEANAPLEATTVMLRMAQDELRHAHGCREVLARLGHTGPFEVETAVEPLARHQGVSAFERALRNVVYTTCCSELVACARFVATLETTTDAFFREALTRLLADERLHGQFGFHYLAWARPQLDASPELSASISRFLRLGFAVLERELAPAHVHRIDDDARAVGLECPEEARELFYGTMEEAVIPALDESGLDATLAWKTRTLDVS